MIANYSFSAPKGTKIKSIFKNIFKNVLTQPAASNLMANDNI